MVPLRIAGDIHPIYRTGKHLEGKTANIPGVLYFPASPVINYQCKV